MKHLTKWVILILLLAACGTTQPTPTPSPIPDTPTTSNIPVPIKTSRPTLDLENISFDVNYSLNFPIDNMLDSPQVLISPNHELVVDYGIDLRVITIEGNVFLEIPNEFGHKVYGGAVWSAVHWSPDNKYIYFSRLPLLDGGTIRRLYNGTGYWRLNTATNEIIEILPAPGESSDDEFVYFGLSTFALSQDGTQLAYIRNEENPLKLVIRNLNSGKEQRFDLNIDDVYDDAGDMIWSPDNSKIVFVRSDKEDITDWESETFSLWMIYLNDRQLIKIMDMDRPGYEIEGWEEDNILKFESNTYFDSLPPNCRILEYDIDRKDFVGFITATPVPTHWPVDYCYPTSTPSP